MIKNIVLFCIISIGTCISLGGYSFGQSQEKADCEIGQSEWDRPKNNLENFFKTSKIFKSEDVEMAHRHLKSYCCARGWISENNCNGAKDANTDFPESPYFFDQLIDIGFKKIGGDSKYTYGLPPDDSAKQYREKVRKLAESADGVQPKQFTDLYEAAWDSKNSDINSSLAAKTRYICGEATSISMDVLKIYSDDMKSKAQSLCSDKAEARIVAEQNYVKNVSVVKGVKYYSDNIDKYLESYFSKTRFDALLEKFSVLVGLLMHVDRKATPGVSTASK